ncbi:unnamed protein product [Rhizophagus irregularis]|uniref:Uncharacterized protein n=1 Tax=Rhizophagus irregularis TaxID=588596 RepID=A0A915ZEA0_9GLOM|nr:unnamed protein product [Rhizophagus irregularis]CAB5179258.1 unnamed protein product [Rhizophagus irregularis]CAB5371290.1 unnamed protein product [Rhizophagus irregularis]
MSEKCQFIIYIFPIVHFIKFANFLFYQLLKHFGKLKMNNRMNQLISYANDMWNCVKTIFGVIIDESFFYSQHSSRERPQNLNE